jgi:hypothetical protein
VLKSNGTAPFPLFLNRYSSLKGGAFGVAEIVTDCSPGRVARCSSVRGLPFDQAVEIQSLLCDLRDEVKDLRYNICQDNKLTDSFEYMQQCWFDPFFLADDQWRVTVMGFPDGDAAMLWSRNDCSRVCHRGSKQDARIPIVISYGCSRG